MGNPQNIFLNDLLGLQLVIPPAPTAVASPTGAIIPEKVKQHHRKGQGRFGGTGTVPLRYQVIRNC